MSEIFISYARETDASARLIANALRAEGYAVWRDDELPAHRDYADVIEERLRAAKAVVVVWSAEAVKSQWVRAEADIARAAGTLVQLSLDGVTLPLPFNRIQCADLKGWAGDETAPGWRKVADSVAELAGRAAPRPAARPSAAPPLRSATSATLSIAVTPMVDPVGVSAGDGLAHGLAAEIATALSRFPVLTVVDVGGDAVRYRLEGGIQRSGSRVRVNLQLCDAVSGERIWAERFDRTLADPFALQDELAGKAACRVESALLAHETRVIATRPIESLTAHELWLRAREAIRRAGLEQVDEIEALGERAMALDPGHGRALALLAAAIGFRITYAGEGADLALKARFADVARRAMLAGADDPEVLTFVSEAHLLADGDMVAARALTDRALQMNPVLAVAWDISANIRMQSGEYEDALGRYERCLDLEPQTPWRTYIWPSMAGCLVAMGRFEEAIVLAKEGLQISPNNPWAIAILVAALAHTGRVDEASAAAAQLDRRQAGVLRTSQLGPRLNSLVKDALKLVDRQ